MVVFGNNPVLILTFNKRKEERKNEKIIICRIRGLVYMCRGRSLCGLGNEHSV
jgi:hypothetical protein